MESTSSSLSVLVSSTPHLLAYAVPLLLIAFLLTFAGTFLTLDRSRSFPPSYAPVPLPGAFTHLKKTTRFTWILQGGVGGLASGYVFGLHLSTFLALLVPATSSSAPLSSNSFLAVWLLSCILTTILAGRYKYCALIFSGISGGSLLALAISLIIHPSLLARQVLTAFLSTAVPGLVGLFSLPRLSRFLHPTLRIATSSAGAFSLILAIAILAHVPAWADIWERLWLQNGDSWGTSKEKGLSAAFSLFLAAGIASDWALWKWLGECPEEKWDNYLTNYAANLPNDASRAGTFQPLTPHSLWARLFHPPSSKDEDILFPHSLSSGTKRDSISKDTTGFLQHDDQAPLGKLQKHSARDTPDIYELPTAPAFLKKFRSPTHAVRFKRKNKSKNSKPSAGGRKPIKFGPDLSSDSSSESDLYSDADVKGRPWLKQKASLSSSTPTLVDEPKPPLPPLDYDMEGELAHVKLNRSKAVGETPDYSDYEEDLGSAGRHGVGADAGAGRREEADGGAGWSPRFLKRASVGSGSGSSVASGNGNVGVPLPMGAVPATPSLIKALDRISAAQKDAFGRGDGLGSVSPPLSGVTSGPNSHHPRPQHQYRQPVPAPMPKRRAQVDGMPRVDERSWDNDSDTDDEESVGRRHPQVTERAPRWEEFWRDVRDKAHS